MNSTSSSDVAKAVVRRNTEEVQGKGNFDVFEEIFADDFVDHTTQPNMTPDKAGVRRLYTYMREAFPDFHAKIHWQLADVRNGKITDHWGVGNLLSLMQQVGGWKPSGSVAIALKAN